MLIIKHAVHTDYPVADPYSTRKEIIAKFGHEECVVIMSDTDFYGVLTPKDCLVSPHILAIDCIDQNAETVQENDTISDVIDIMFQKNRLALGVVDNKNVFLGPVTLSGIFECMATTFEFEPSVINVQTYSGTMDFENMKKNLFRELSHHIYNQIQIIFSSSKMLSKEVKDAEQQMFIGSILKAGENLTHSVSSILTSELYIKQDLS